MSARVRSVLLLSALISPACGSGAPESTDRAPMLVVARIDRGGISIESASSAVWVPNEDEEYLYRVDPETNEVVARIHSGHANLPGGGREVVVAGDRVWSVYPVGTDPPSGFDGDPEPYWERVFRKGKPTRIDLYRDSTAGGVVLFDGSRNKPRAKMLFLDWTPDHITETSEGVWISTGEELVLLDHELTRTIARVEGVRGPLEAASDAAWGMCGESVCRIDPHSHHIGARVHVGDVREIAADGDSLWVTTDEELVRIDSSEGVVSARVAIEDPWALAAADGDVVVTGFRERALYRVDPAQNAVVDRLDLTGIGDESRTITTDVAIGHGSAWVAFADVTLRVDLTGSVRPRTGPDAARKSETAAVARCDETTTARARILRPKEGEVIRSTLVPLVVRTSCEDATFSVHIDGTEYYVGSPTEIGRPVASGEFGDVSGSRLDRTLRVGPGTHVLELRPGSRGTGLPRFRPVKRRFAVDPAD